MTMASQLKVGIFVDAGNLFYCGGAKMRYDVLRQYGEQFGPCLVLNTYLTFDAERASTDSEYRFKTNRFYRALTGLGYCCIRKEVTWYKDDRGKMVGKANADMDLGVDMILAADNLDVLILVSGDGDFIKVIEAIKARGRRVEVIGMENVSSRLQDTTNFTSGYLIPNLIPVNGNGEPRSNAPRWGEIGSTVRGVCYHHSDGGFGFLQYLPEISPLAWLADNRHPDSPWRSVYFRDVELPGEIKPANLPDKSYLFEFEVGEATQGPCAHNIRLLTRYNY